MTAQSIGLSGLKEELPIRQVPPTTQRIMEANGMEAIAQPQKRNK